MNETVPSHIVLTSHWVRWVSLGEVLLVTGEGGRGGGVAAVIGHTSESRGADGGAREARMCDGLQ